MNDLIIWEDLKKKVSNILLHVFRVSTFIIGSSILTEHFYGYKIANNKMILLSDELFPSVWRENLILLWRPLI